MALFQLATNFTDNIVVQGESALENHVRELGNVIKSRRNPVAEVSVSRDRIDIEYTSGTTVCVRGRFIPNQRIEISHTTTVVGRTFRNLESIIQLNQDLGSVASFLEVIQATLVHQGFTML